MRDPVAELIANGKPKAAATYGTMGVISGERGSYAGFWNCFHAEHMNTLATQPGTKLRIQQGVDVCGNYNELIRRLDGDWLWLMGDDHFWQVGLLTRLLEHDVDVVIPHCLKRNPPWPSVVYAAQDENDHFVPALLPEDELVEIHAGGSAGMLIRRRVLDAIGDPWFTPSPDAVGLNEDVYFCQKVREAGFRIWCDPGALLGHIATYTIYPRWNGEDWGMEAVFDQNTTIPLTRIAEVPA